MAKDDEMKTMAQVAAEFGIPLRTVQYAAERGHLTTKRFGKVRLTTSHDVKTWLNSDKKRQGRTP